jgi:4-amino-4-deoxy-L-arabinose transferase-like glycosyltransferase
LAILLCALLVVHVLFFHRLADRDLWSSHEARAGMDAASVLDGQPFPHLFDGRAEVQKPPLYYWLVAGIARLRGGEVDALAVRLPAAVAAFLTVALLGWQVERLRPGAGWLTALILASGIHFTWLARIARIDMPLTLTVTVSSLAFYLATRPSNVSRAFQPDSADPKSGWKARPTALLFGYLAAALGVLFKGPIGLVLPAAVTAANLLLEGRWPAFWEVRAWRDLVRELGLVWGVPLVLVLTVSVFLWADVATNGRFLPEFVGHHNLGRGLGGDGLRSHPWWLYGPFFLLYFLPWSPFVLLALPARHWRCDPLARFGLAWLLAVTAVLSCAHFKRDDYLLPAYPGAALFLGCVLDRWCREAARGQWVLRLVLVVAGVTVLGQWVRVEFLLPAEEPYRDYRAFGSLIRQRAPAPEEVIFFRTEAHALAFHVGRPQTVLVEWDQLRERLRSSSVAHVVTPPEWVEQCSRNLPGLRPDEVARNTDFNAGKHERPLVLLRFTSSQR